MRPREINQIHTSDRTWELENRMRTLMKRLEEIKGTIRQIKELQ